MHRIVLDFYELNEHPFKDSHDSRFIYMSPMHRQALDFLLWQLEVGRGITTLLAQPGLGKSTLLHALSSHGNLSPVYVLPAAITSADLLRTLLAKFNAHHNENPKEMLIQLQEFAVKADFLGSNVIVVIDEAQSLDLFGLDLIDRLSALLTPRGAFIQFILGGPPKLVETLAAIKPVEWTRQVVPAAHLEPLSLEDTALYVDHRLRAAGFHRRAPLLTSEAEALVARYSGGNPRVINTLCAETIATAYRRRREQIGGDIVREVAASLDLPHSVQPDLNVRPIRNTLVPSVSDLNPLLLQPEKHPDMKSRREENQLLIAVAQKCVETKAANRNRTFMATLESTLLKWGPRDSEGIHCPSDSRPVLSLTFGVLLVLAVMAIVVAMHLARTSASTAGNIVAVSSLPQPAAPVLRLSNVRKVIEAGPHVSPHYTNITPAPDSGEHNLKGMDLKSALRTLYRHKQRTRIYR